MACIIYKIKVLYIFISELSTEISFLILKIDLLALLSGNVVIYVIDYNFISKKIALLTSH